MSGLPATRPMMSKRGYGSKQHDRQGMVGEIDLNV